MCFPQGMHDNISVDSCHGTIRYQAVEGLVTNGRTMKNVVVRKQQGHPHGKSIDLGSFYGYISSTITRLSIRSGKRNHFLANQILQS